MSYTSAFEAATQVTAQGANRYSAYLQPNWCIGTVPHGGYTTSVLYRLALTHFENNHPKLYPDGVSPISIQLSFLRKTAAGMAILEVDDVKLGARTSTVHVKLLQAPDKQKQKDQLEVKIAGYVTVSPPSAEVGVSAPTGWTLHPPPPAGSLPEGQVDLAALSKTGQDGAWTKLELPYPDTRQAETHIQLYGPRSGPTRQGAGVIQCDQWSRFRPGGGTYIPWTDQAVVYLADLVPMLLDRLDSVSKATTQADGDQQKAQFWYPTVSLTIDLKKRLPPQGADWLYTRGVTKVLHNGRADQEITVLDESGEVVALSTQVGLVVSANRNSGSRKGTKL